MSYKDFLHITPKEFYLSLKSKSEYDGMIVESNVQFICNTIRMQTLYLYNPIVDKKDRKRDPRKLMNFPWDKDSYKTQSAEEMKKSMKAIVGAFKNNPKKEKK